MLLKILQLKFKILFRILGELTFFGKVVLLALCAAALYAVYELTGFAPQRFQVAGAAAAILLLALIPTSCQRGMKIGGLFYV